uniref:hypothetical protein n=1 Tax=Gemmiger formicilis TaxID=745368 RepID=UPI0040289195
MLFLTGADHGHCGKEKRTRQINLLSATVSLQVVISLCKSKETAALNFSKPPLHKRVKMCLLYDGFFSFAVVRQIDGLFSYGLHYLWADFQTFRPVYARQIPLDCISRCQLMFRDVRCSSGRNHE